MRPSDPGPEEKDPLFVTSLARGMEVLSCFTAAKTELGVSEIARMTGLPQPTAWRLCHTLLTLGYLEPVPGRQTLAPGTRLVALGRAASSGRSISDFALPHMSAIAARHEGAVSLGVRDGLAMLYLQRCQGPSIIHVNLRVGSRVPIATSATGWAYIAGLPSEERETVISELAEEKLPNWQDVEARLRSALVDFDEAGYIINLGLLHPQINSVAVPITAPDSATIMSLSSGGINQLFPLEKLVAIGLELKALAGKLAPLLSLQEI